MKYLKPNFKLKDELIKKHQHGQEKYGAFSFLNDGRDMKLEAADELLDAINYLTYQAIKKHFGGKTIKTWSVNKFNEVYILLISNFTSGNIYLDKNRQMIAELIKLINKLNVKSNNLPN
jgi:hypothetical protein